MFCAHPRIRPFSSVSSAHNVLTFHGNARFKCWVKVTVEQKWVVIKEKAFMPKGHIKQERLRPVEGRRKAGRFARSSRLLIASRFLLL